MTNENEHYEANWNPDDKFWRKLAISFLASPPDAQLAGDDRDDAGLRAASAAFDEVGPDELKAPDHPFAFPAFPVSGDADAERKIMHPLSGEEYEVNAEYIRDAVENAVKTVAAECSSEREKFLKLWRNLPAECDS